MNRLGRLILGAPDQGAWAVRARMVMTMVPGREPVQDGVVLSHGNRIAAVDTYRSLAPDLGCETLDLGDEVLAPGLFNSHVHLELSHLLGATRQGQGFVAWLRSMLAQGMEPSDTDAINLAVQQMRNAGVVHAADVSTRHPDLTAAALDEHLPLFHILAEFIGQPKQTATSDLLDLDWPPAAKRALERFPHAVAAAGHALYSTAPQVLQAAKQWCNDHGRVFSLHLAEHEDEDESLLHGQGEFHAMLAQGLLPRDHEPPRIRPVPLADSLGLLDERTLAVHCVRVDDADMEILSRRRVTVCLCPRSNAYIGVGNAPWNAMRGKGLRICLGTDSLASNHDLDPWNEVRFLLENSASHITLAEALAWMTVNPARVFGLEHEAGILATGCLAAMSLVPEDLSFA